MANEIKLRATWHHMPIKLNGENAKTSHHHFQPLLDHYSDLRWFEHVDSVWYNVAKVIRYLSHRVDAFQIKQSGFLEEEQLHDNALPPDYNDALQYFTFGLEELRSEVESYGHLSDRSKRSEVLWSLSIGIWYLDVFQKDRASDTSYYPTFLGLSDDDARVHLERVLEEIKRFCTDPMMALYLPPQQDDSASAAHATSEDVTAAVSKKSDTAQ